MRHILTQFCEKIRPTFLVPAHRVLGQAIASGVLHVAEFAHCLASSTGFRHALLRELSRAHVEIEAKLVVEIFAQSRRGSTRKAEKPTKAIAHTGSNTLNTASAYVRQVAASVRNCLRPSAVT